MNAQQMSYKIYNVILTVSLQYLITAKHIKRHILKSAVTVFYYSTARVRL